MTLNALNPYIIIKVPKNEEIQRREKIGELYLPPSYVWMTRNTQCGIIESISDEAIKNFPQIAVGNVLLVHHFVQGSLSMSENDKQYLVYEDEEFNYYNVTSMQHYGKNNQTYAIWNGENIITHPDYIFLKKEQPNAEVNEFGYFETTENILAKQEDIKNQIMVIMQGGLTEEKKRVVEKMEHKQLALTQKIHQKEYQPYTVAFSNPKHNIKDNSVVFCLNAATTTLIEFNNVEYRVCPIKYVVAKS